MAITDRPKLSAAGTRTPLAKLLPQLYAEYSEEPDDLS